MLRQTITDLFSFSQPLPPGRRPSRLLTGALTIMLLLVVLTLPIEQQFHRAYPNYLKFQTAILIATIINFLLCYWLNWRGYSRTAKFLTLVAASIAIFGLSWPHSGDRDTWAILYLIIPIGLSSAFLPLNQSRRFSVANLLFLGLYLLALPPQDRFQFFAAQYVFIAAITGLVHLIAYYRERVEHHRQARLVESEARFRQLAATIHEAFWLIDLDPPRLLYVSPRYEEIWGRQTDALLTQKDLLSRTLHPDDLHKYLMGPEGLERAKTQPYDEEYRILRPDGQVRWVRTRLFPVLDERGQVYRLAGTSEDITERKETEVQQLKLALEQERMQVVSELVQAISHDFRNALATIETSRHLTERLLEAGKEGRIPAKLTTISTQVGHMTEQLENLQSLSALSNLRFVTCGINSLLEVLVTEQSQRAAQKGVQMAFQPAPGLPMAKVDQTELGRAIRHLLVNAITHTPAGGSVYLRSCWGDGQIGIEVQDTGAGIDPRHQTHIFEMFYRSNPARPLHEGGIGLGLSIVRMIVEAHNGRVTLQSAPGVGSTFTIWLPAAPQPA
jgi:PAS domain S-box-containing protein